MKIIQLFVVFIICSFFSPSFSEEYTNDENSGEGESYDDVLGGSGSEDTDEVVTSFKPELPASPSKDDDAVVTEDVHFDTEGEGVRAEPEIDKSEHDGAHHDQLSLKNPAVIALIIGGVIFVLLIILLMTMFVVYRLRKKDEGSYALDENMKKQSKNIVYTKAPLKQDEFFA